MAKVTCRCCGEKIDKKIAVGVPHGKTTWNYCPEHVGQKSSKEKMYDLIYEIFGRRVLNTILYKELDQVASVYSYEIITAFIEENKSFLEQLMYRSYSSEFAQIRYFSSVIKNGLHDFKMKQPEPIIKKEIEVGFDVPANKYKTKKPRKGIDNLLDDLL